MELRNNFHNTTATTKYSAQERCKITERVYTGVATPAEYAAMHRAWKKLCGMTGCVCGDSWGERKS